MGEVWEVADAADRAALADALAAQPLVARRIANGQPPQVPFTAMRANPVVEELFASLDLVGTQLCYLAKLNGGATLAAARIEAPELDVATLQRAARRLQLSGLAGLAGDRLVLADVLDDALNLSQPTLSGAGEYLTSDAAGQACAWLGLEAPRRKGERIAQLAGVLGDRDRLIATLSELGPAATEVFERVLAATLDGHTHGYDVPGSVLVYEVLPDELQRSRHRFGHGYGSRAAGVVPPRSPLDELCDRQLLGSNWSRSQVWVWAETLVALRGRLFDRWTPHPTPSSVALPPVPHPAAAVAGAVRDLLAHVAANPPLGKRTGGCEPPVKYWRSAAKALGLVAEQVLLLGELAIRIGLLVPLTGPTTGRGRNATTDIRWHPEPQRAAAFDALPLGERWAMIVDQWLHDGALEACACRVLLLDLLCGLPAGHGVRASELGPWAADRHRLLRGAVLDDAIGALLHLGVAVDSGGVIGLGESGRAVLHDRPALAQLLEAGASTFVCQPDHSVIAPAELRPAVAEQLRRIATLESHGGATVWRLDAAAIGREALRRPAEQLVAFLHEHSSVPVPASVERFVLDSARVVAPLTVSPAGCVVTGVDVVALADAARIKAAKLTVLAPGVAVSPLSQDKVTEVLLAKGIALTAAGRGGGPGADTAPGGLPAIDPASVTPVWLVAHRPLGDPLPSIGAIGAGVGPLQHAAVAASIAGDGPPGGRARPRRRPPKDSS